MGKAFLTQIEAYNKLGLSGGGRESAYHKTTVVKYQ